MLQIRIIRLPKVILKHAVELQNGVNAIYSSLRAGNLVGREWFFTHDMRGGETASGGAQLEAPRAELLTQPTASPSNSVMTSVWNGAYQMINRANLIFDKAPDVTDNAAPRDVTLVGEADFLRAWAYFELVSSGAMFHFTQRQLLQLPAITQNRRLLMFMH